MPNIFSLFDEGDPSDPTYRSAMMPVGSYKNPDGSESLGFAWPGMITEPINALSRLADNSRFPDGRLGIPNPHNLENQNDVLTALLATHGGNALSPTRMLEGAAARVASDTGRPSLLGGLLADEQAGPEQRPSLLSDATNPTPGNYLRNRMNKPWQPQPGEDYKSYMTPENQRKWDDWKGRRLRHDLPPAQAQELLKKDPQYEETYRGLLTKEPIDYPRLLP